MQLLRCLSTLIVIIMSIISVACSENTLRTARYDITRAQVGPANDESIGLNSEVKPALGWFMPQPYVSNTTLKKRAHPSVVTGFVPDHCDEQKRAKEAFPLMLRLVQFSLSYLANPTKTDSFNRYFQPSHRRTVFKVFRSYFTPEQPAPLGDPSSPKFSNVAIAYGKQPFGDAGDCTDNERHTWLAHFYNTVPGAPNFAARALILCPAAFTETPNELPRPGDASRCPSLAAFATYDMDSLSATLLHEFLHYRFLINHATSSDIVDWNVNPPYEETKVLPKSGYGPYSTFYLNKKSTITTTPQRDPRLNADNYVWFALEVYWGAMCSRGFVDPVRGENT